MSVARAINRVKSAPRPLRVPPKGKGGHSTLPVGVRPNHPNDRATANFGTTGLTRTGRTDRGPLRNTGSAPTQGTIDAINKIKKRPRAAVLAARKTKVLAAIDRMKADQGKTQADRQYTWKTQARLTQEARNRGWLK
jgi:hypothetical protein